MCSSDLLKSRDFLGFCRVAFFVLLQEMLFLLLNLLPDLLYDLKILHYGEEMEESKSTLTKSILQKSDCIDLIKEKAAELEKSREQRLPKRSDFSDLEVMMIKSYFGPFPRALEAAGVKQKRQGIEQKRLEKRIRAKRNKLKYKLAKKAGKEAEKHNEEQIREQSKANARQQTEKQIQKI